MHNGSIAALRECDYRFYQVGTETKNHETRSEICLRARQMLTANTTMRNDNVERPSRPIAEMTFVIKNST